jgi:hypothetical protein
MTALRYLQDMQRDGHINALGLVNFDAVRTDEICTQLGPGSIVSNQVQVCSLASNKSPLLPLSPSPPLAATISDGRTWPYQYNMKKKVKKKISDAQSWLHTQFSLIDTRPLHGMADVCEKHSIKLLTYGTVVRIAPTPLTPASPPGLS